MMMMSAMGLDWSVHASVSIDLAFILSSFFFLFFFLHHRLSTLFSQTLNSPRWRVSNVFSS